MRRKFWVFSTSPVEGWYFHDSAKYKYFVHIKTVNDTHQQKLWLLPHRSAQPLKVRPPQSFASCSRMHTTQSLREGMQTWHMYTYIQHVVIMNGTFCALYWCEPLTVVYWPRSFLCWNERKIYSCNSVHTHMNVSVKPLLHHLLIRIVVLTKD